MFEPVYDVDDSAAIIKVVGVGGGGGNAINHMIEKVSLDEMNGVSFYSINTDAQALRKSKAAQTVQIGSVITKGLGAGANPNIGKSAAEEDKESIRNILEGSDMVFIAAGMGGGTGTGAAPVISEVSKELGILTVAVVTKPFSFEGKKRMALADQGIRELSKYVDSVIIIPNEKLLKVLGKNVTLVDAFGAANDILSNAVRGISDMITSPGFINVDFADVRTVMSEMGHAMMGTGIGRGEPTSDRAEKAAQDAVASPLLEDVNLNGARGVLVNITAGNNLGLNEFQIVGDTVRAFASEEATIVVGTTLMPEMEDEFRVTIVATGIESDDLTPLDLKGINKSINQSQSHNFNQPIQSGFHNHNHTPAHNQYGNRSSHPVGNYANPAENTATKVNINDDDVLDIPAFLRKQAD